ncbi:MAG: long-chain fatty acid--CoA ligase, partial [Gammaproteobacteria bacterium]|nr:long-chain fatty acid--CoA ligase [Gammaproteobacteria bacterium]
MARLAGALRARGVEHGDRVAMLADNSDRYVEYYFATLWAGGVILPINTRWSTAEVSGCIADAEPRLIIADDKYFEVATTIGTEQRLRVPALATSDWDAVIAESAAVEDARRSGEDLAALFYTGGTTGRAKGVMLCHRNFFANSMMHIANLGLTGRDAVHLHVSPMFHVAGGARLFSVTMAGATHAVLPNFEPDAFLSAVERHRVTVTVVVPTVLNRLVAHDDLDRYDLSSLRLLSYGASPMPESLLQRAMQRMPNIAFLQSYGMTELSPVATMLLPQYHAFEGPTRGTRGLPGSPCSNAEVVIMDANDVIVGPHVVGEVCVRGPMVMQGYWRAPQATAAAVRDGFMHTGDAGYLDERGFLFLVDRVKDMIITGGENVYSVEVENVLYQHPSVHECAVIGIPSDAWGEAVHAIV